ncbi:SNF2 family N-terminal domain-containing protein [Microdochium trichocladiopsis]|uniref:SNF2 family N-terminal domain-containing protein n=1 Tax=Microdochium trichocladiopsis TaxID=1682393 RepID=A0A9P9BHU9_9PEZI|nr:SNF2 family N-terminal domain-containing protein [Microdochium trichocladiopsis]KAH7012301.1 SNF2 family N-terminal domain-containing protein [Microdochium trichocladiopsis]
MIQSLLEEPDLSLHARCYPDEQSGTRKSVIQQCTIDITVCGPFSQLDEVGTWFQDYEVYLQDPRHCHQNVRYCNPHRLSSSDLDSCPWLSDYVSDKTVLEFEEITDRRDVLDVFSTRKDLEEADQPAAILTALKKHQKQALTFMLEREKGWNYRSAGGDVWEVLDSSRIPVFLNTVSNSCQAEEPPQFYGGIVADTMGLGKTLTMISLVTTDHENDQQHCHVQGFDNGESCGRPTTSATLIIVPPPRKHVRPGCINVHIHHRKTRLGESSTLKRGDIVLTTFHTVSADWKPAGTSHESFIFSRCWRRIILDEAHFIKNGNTRITKAVCALEAVARWAVTGTPIQNRLSDLATLLQFVRPHPYGDPRCFDADISQLWKSGQSTKAVERLKLLSASLVLRRSQGTIELPPRKDLLCPVDFTQKEREVYERMREHAITRIDDALHEGHQQQRAHGSSHVNALQQIEALRLFSDLGLHYHSRPSAMADSEEWEQQAQAVLYRQCELGPVICIQCSSATDMTEIASDDGLSSNTSKRQEPRARFFSCLRFICSDCVDNLGRSRRSLPCGHTKSCAFASVSTSLTSKVDDTVVAHNTLETSDSQNFTHMSSKVKALVADIHTVPAHVKCLTLTAASRAYLLEPHWNPTLEDQALARVHRLGQERPVTTIRLYMRNSFEEEVMKLQDSKRDLAGILLSPHDGIETDTSLGTLERLRSLL